MGQSASAHIAHIAVCALVTQAIKEYDVTQTPTLSVCQIKAYFGLSGGLDGRLLGGNVAGLLTAASPVQKAKFPSNMLLPSMIKIAKAQHQDMSPVMRLENQWFHILTMEEINDGGNR